MCSLISNLLSSSLITYVSITTNLHGTAPVLLSPNILFLQEVVSLAKRAKADTMAQSSGSESSSDNGSDDDVSIYTLGGILNE